MNRKQQFAIVLFFAFPFRLISDASRAEVEVMTRELSDGRVVVIGSLSRPLGTPVEIECTVIEGKSLEGTGFQTLSGSEMLREFQLKVDHVEGKSLVPSVVMRFVVPDSRSVFVAPSWHKLEQLLKDLATAGARLRYEPTVPSYVIADTMTAEEIELFRRNYVGSRHTLVVYETGTFEGRPKNLPEDCERYMSTMLGFTFSTYLVVLAER